MKCLPTYIEIKGGLTVGPARRDHCSRRQATGLKMRDRVDGLRRRRASRCGREAQRELAQQAGLAMGEGGVLVDASLRTSDPDIYAVGDIAAAEHHLWVPASVPSTGPTRSNSPRWRCGMLGRPGEYAELPICSPINATTRHGVRRPRPSCDRVVFRGNVAGRSSSPSGSDGDVKC